MGPSLENISSNSLKSFSIGGGRFMSSLLVAVHVIVPLQKTRLGCPHLNDGIIMELFLDL